MTADSNEFIYLRATCIPKPASSEDPDYFWAIRTETEETIDDSRYAFTDNDNKASERIYLANSFNEYNDLVVILTCTYTVPVNPVT